jgi:hypothetical protein
MIDIVSYRTSMQCHIQLKQTVVLQYGIIIIKNRPKHMANEFHGPCPNNLTGTT